MKRVLVNFISIGRNGIDIPRLLKLQAINSLGCELDLFSGTFIKKIEPAEKDVYTFNETIPEFKSLPEINWTKTKFMLYALEMNIKGLFRVRGIIKNDYDVIYSPASVLEFLLIPFVVKLFSRKIIWVSVFDNTVPFTEPGNRFSRFLAWIFFRFSLALLKKADTIFVVSEDLRDFMLRKGFSRHKIILSANGIENELIKTATADSKCNIDALFVGRINEAKGIYDMLEVLRLVRKKYPHFQLAVMGEGDEITKRKFREKIKEMDLGNNVQLLGFKTGLEKFEIIKSSRCFLFLSTRESFGIALLEAVCSGIPVLAYDLPQFARLYPNGEVDISPKGDWKMVAEKVISLFERGNFSNEKGKLLIDKYSWKKVAEIEYNAIKIL